MKIIYHHRTRGDGAEGIHIGEIISAFESMGHQVKLVCPWMAKRSQGLDKKQASSNTGGKKSWLAQVLKQVADIFYNCISFAKLAFWIVVYRPAFVYERYSAYHFGGMLATALLRTPSVLEVNATYTGMFGCRFTVMFPRVLKFAERFALHRASVVVVVSEAIKECVSRQVGGPKSILVLPNAINEQKCLLAKSKAKESVKELRAKLELHSDFVIGFVGSLRKWHGIDFLIESIPKIFSECPDAQFLIVGSGEMEKDLRQYVEKNSLESRVVLHQAVDHDLVFDYLGVMAIGLMPDSNNFGSPMKILEYMAMGVVPVAPRLGPIEEIVRDGDTGMLFNQRDCHSFVEVVKKLYLDRSLTRDIAVRAEDYVFKNRLWGINAEKTIEAIGRFIGDR